MRFVCISDTHDRQDRIVVPDGDVLLHAGDLTMKGDLPEIVTAFEWLSKLPHERIVFVPGNHDFAFQDVPETTAGLAARFPRVTILIDRAIVIGTFRIYGSPYQPWFHDWAFNFSPGEAGRSEAVDRWALIPGDTEILITHGPVRGILDRTFRGEPVGCPELRARIEDLRQLRLHVCGHIHEAYGSERHGDVLYVNASSCDLKYRPTQPPIVVDLDPAPGPP
jgi:Icc-related predicted phosphoesterase